MSWFDLTLYFWTAVLIILRGIKWYLRRKWGSVDKSNEVSVKGKIVVVTGASAGIGKWAALEFAKRDATVILACRNEEKADKAIEWIRNKTSLTSLGQLVSMKLDLGSLQSVRGFAKEFKAKYDHIGILVNNAGVVFSHTRGRIVTSDGFEVQMGTNHLGHFLLTNLLLDKLKKGAPSRVVTVASMGHIFSKLDLNDLMNERGNDKPPLPLIPSMNYVNSKMANCLFNKELAKRLKGTGVTTYALCPGAVATDMLDRGVSKYIRPLMAYFMKTPEEGAQTTIYCALSKDLANQSGEMYQNCRFWPEKDRIELKDEDAKKLWEISEKLVGLGK